MTAQTLSQARSNPDSLLRRGLLGNALFSGTSGLIFILTAPQISRFLGWPPSNVILVIGLLLLGYAPLLYALASKPAVDLRLAVGVVVADELWVLGSLFLIISNWFPITAGGRWAIGIVAMFVLDFAIIQFIGIRRVKKDH